MTEYNEGARGRARYWMDRAQRAEAECERLRSALEDIARGPLQEPIEFGDYARAVANSALATPPPVEDKND